MLEIALVYWLGATLYGLICTVIGLKSVRVKSSCEIIAAAYHLTPNLVFHGIVVISAVIWPISIALDACRLIDENLLSR